MDKGPIRQIYKSRYMMGAVLLAMLFCGNCAYYHTRLFDLNEGRVKGQNIAMGQYGQKCGPYLIHPVVFALGYTTGSHERIEDPDNYHTFSVSVSIDYCDSTNLPNEVVLENIISTFTPGDIIVRFNLLNSCDTLILIRSIKSIKYVKGIVYSYEPLDIPPHEDSITVIVPLNINSQGYEGATIDKCDTLRFNMHRVDYKKLDFWNP